MSQARRADEKARGSLYATLTAIAARLIPSDDAQGGAAEANAAAYIVRVLAGEHAAYGSAYSAGIDVLERHCAERFGASFVELDLVAQEELLAQVRADAPWFGGGGEKFFELVRGHVIEGTFCDPRWGGNAGCVGWRLLGYGGPRLRWTAEDQEIGELSASRGRE